MMEDIFVPPDRGSKRLPKDRGGGSAPPPADPPPEISVTSDEGGTTPIRSPFQAWASSSSSNDTDLETSQSDEFPIESFKSGTSLAGTPEPEQFLPYDPDPFPPFWVFESPELPSSSPPSEHGITDMEDQDPSTSDSDGDANNITDDKEEEEDENGEDGEEEEDWSMASSEPWQLVGDHRQDGHSTPSDFVVPSVGTPSIPDDLMSFSSDPDEVSFYDGDESEDDSKVLGSNIGILFNTEDRKSTPAAVRSKSSYAGHLSREDTLEDESGGDLEHPIFYDINDNLERSMPLEDPLLLSLVLSGGRDRAGLEDNFQDNNDPLLLSLVLSGGRDRAGLEDNFQDTNDTDEEMDTPRAPSMDHVYSVTSLHSSCTSSSADPDLLMRPGGNRETFLLEAPQGDTRDRDPNPSPDSMQEECFFDSGNFQRMDEAYEYYPANFTASKFDVFGSRFRKRDRARECRGWW